MTDHVAVLRRMRDEFIPADLPAIKSALDLARVVKEK